MSNVRSVDKYNKLWNKLREVEADKEKANQAYKRGDIETALEMYTRLLDADADNSMFLSSIYANRSLCFLKREMYEEAIGDLTKSIDLNSTYLKAYMRRGAAYYAIKRYDRAAADFKSALAIDPSETLIRLS